MSNQNNQDNQNESLNSKIEEDFKNQIKTSYAKSKKEAGIVAKKNHKNTSKAQNTVNKSKQNSVDNKPLSQAKQSHQVSNPILAEAKRKQPKIMKYFMDTIKQNKLSHAYLFSGESGVGKLATALSIAMRLFCTNVKKGNPCGQCEACQHITNNENPDVIVIKPTGTTIKIDQVRMLKKQFTMSASSGNIRVFIIQDADKLTVNAMNSLLKFIEEPSGNIVSFLLTTNKSALLPTIISRTQVIEFPSLPAQVFEEDLEDAHLDPNTYNMMNSLTNSIKTAKEWSKNNWFANLQNAVGKWFKQIEAKNLSAFPNIQIQLLPLARTKQTQHIMLEMILQIWCDVLHIKYEHTMPSGLKFPQYAGDMSDLALDIPDDKLMKIIKMALNNERLFQRNVSFENILGSFALNTIKVLSHKDLV